MKNWCLLFKALRGAFTTLNGFRSKSFETNETNTICPCVM